jgi:hypothetical protein
MVCAEGALPFANLTCSVVPSKKNPPGAPAASACRAASEP